MGALPRGRITARACASANAIKALSFVSSKRHTRRFRCVTDRVGRRDGGLLPGLARRFAVELAEHYRCAVDLAIHRPKQGADPRHNHAHLLMTTRELTPQGLGKRLSLELSGRPRCQAGLQGEARTEFVAVRAAGDGEEGDARL